MDDTSPLTPEEREAIRQARRLYMADYRRRRRQHGGQYETYCVDCGSTRTSSRLVGGKLSEEQA